MQKLLLFDIDGTLLRSYGAGTRAMLRAAMVALGERCAGAKISMSGALDPWIFQQIARHGGYDPHDAAHGEFREHYTRFLAEELLASERQCQAMPGVLALLGKLRAERPAVLGMLTGNYAASGSLKLRHVGIDPDWFSPIAWGDAASDRPSLVKVALQALPHIAPADVIVIGDTPRDVDCAHKNGARCLAVLTGDHDEAELLAAGADRVVADLSDPRPLYEMLAS